MHLRKVNAGRNAKDDMDVGTLVNDGPRALGSIAAENLGWGGRREHGKARLGKCDLGKGGGRQETLGNGK